MDDTPWNRMANALEWMADHFPPDLTDKQAVAAAIEAGGFCAIAQHRNAAPRSPDSTRNDLLEYADSRLEDCQPFDSKTLFERGTKDELRVLVTRERPGCLTEIFWAADLAVKQTQLVLRAVPRP